MYILLVLVTILVLVIVILYSLYNILNVTFEPVVTPLLKFDNESVPLIEPPTEIVIEGNSHECHSNLTPCSNHMDCDICREGLANCQYFHDKTILRMRDADGNETEHTILPGESYCMALDRERARSCNPNTGLWLLAESAVGFALLCTCLAPGLVTQLNMYEDCNVAVGCQPNGHIANLNESPLSCVCDDHTFVSDFDEITQTPFCRPKTVRDVVYDENVFPRAPCDDGFVRIDHPALDDVYRRELRLGDICVVDPCSVDPISGQRTRGRLQYIENLPIYEFKFCACNVADNLFAVYSEGSSMVGPSSHPVPNACIQPFNVNLNLVPRIDYKFFWGQSDTLFSDDDVVAVTQPILLSNDRYRRIAYPFLSSHPEVSSLFNMVLLKFSIAHSPNVFPAQSSVFGQFRLIEPRTGEPCLYPGAGRCIVANSNYCIRRHTNIQVGTAETTTNSWCYFSRTGNFVRIWRLATNYLHGQYPLAMRINLLFALRNNVREYTTVQLIRGGSAVSGDINIVNLARVLDTYENYSV
ncbi:Per os infectivity factor 1 [Trabala vishnou gigantina nucleopolyhedrovirus]|uniref:Per os infectivity factor 1 n=1 Tax=Trabala vishnou gigantina nucleopolyhedrovirus TaxID=2863583 RepID=UPI002481A26C|nr:Per os infectivity factor 1 [Trabala vishnou gigantina nucleopolyhedrovirus]QYC92666.1 Per os infectivity factor 1 [Trabala vishnou gigantina nucleopolyhedrovirus]